MEDRPDADSDAHALRSWRVDSSSPLASRRNQGVGLASFAGGRAAGAFAKAKDPAKTMRTPAHIGAGGKGGASMTRAERRTEPKRYSVVTRVVEAASVVAMSP